MPEHVEAQPLPPQLHASGSHRCRPSYMWGLLRQHAAPSISSSSSRRYRLSSNISSSGTCSNSMRSSACSHGQHLQQKSTRPIREHHQPGSSDASAVQCMAIDGRKRAARATRVTVRLSVDSVSVVKSISSGVQMSVKPSHYHAQSRCA